MIDVDALLVPLSEESPCGDNLEYDAEFMALEEASRGKPEREIGGARIEAEEPDWRDVEERALAVLSRTRDLRPAMLLARALTRNDGVAGLAQAIDLAARLVDEQWEQVHPQLDPDDGYDPIMRVNALSALVDETGLLRDLRLSRFVSAPGLGACTVRDALVALDQLDPGDEPSAFSLVQIEGMLREAAGRGEPNHAQQALDHLRRLTRTLDDRAGITGALEAAPLVRMLQALSRLYATASGAGEAGAGAEEGAESGESTGGAPVSHGGGTGDLRTREDAIRLLTKVCEFIERTEPTNPAPLLIRRAQRLMTLSFVEIMREMAPEGIDSIAKIAGLPHEEAQPPAENY